MLGGCATPSTIYDGVYIWGAEVETFTACGSDQEWWVLANESIWLRLRDAHQALTTQPYEGIHVLVSGYYDGPATEERGGGFATEYDGLFRVTEVLATRKRDDSGCDAPANLPR